MTGPMPGPLTQAAVRALAAEAQGARATYTGPTVMAAFSRPKRPFLMHGQRVLVVTRQPLAGTVGVRYDPSDPTHHGCSESTLTTITGVPVADIEEES